MTLQDSQKRALVIGGSMSGLFAGILLRRGGWSVDIYERSQMELEGRGAGIVTHAAMRAVLRSAGCNPGSDLGIDISVRKTLDASGALIGSYPCPQTLTSWERVFRLLRAQFPAEHYHLGKELLRIENGREGVLACFSDGTRAHGVVLVGADGFRSTTRAAIIASVQPLYAGYVAWRGLVDERLLSAGTHADAFEAMVFGLPPGEQFISYPIAGADNDLRPMHRRCNFVWYRPAGEAQLNEMMADRSGRTHLLGIPPPLIRPEFI